MPEDFLIEAEDLSRHYGERRAVDGLGLTVRRGEVLGLLGPNGAGKSTTLRMLSGNLAPGTGGIRINGIDLLSRPRIAKRNIGYLPDRPPLYPELTVDEYLAYCARLHGVGRKGATRAVDSAKERCGLETAGQRLIGNLSKGYCQRVGIAQAIVHRPAVIILDEPTVGLDPIQLREIRDLIRELGRDHGVLLSTHILPEVQTVCDRVQVIVEGRSVYDDDLEALHAGAGGVRYLLRFAKPPQEAVLASLPGVTAVRTLMNGEFSVSLEGEDATAALLEASLSGGWGLRTLSPERMTLEEVFMDLVYRERGQAA
ncbi:MAG: ABC transporter ATP-binding protein [Gammaproteobacteria bacterium]|jgi:ABC-2 type transport system ATP-binding protein|nr:ABC transporter ATP-binding protein [Gammaproteobacteria bacterium]